MKRYYCFLFTILFLLSGILAVRAQESDLTRFNRDRLARSRTSMWILGGWGAVNLATGAVGAIDSRGEARAFHQSNLIWGAVNLGIAASSLLAARRTDPAGFDLYATTKAHHQTQKVFLFNAGLDVGYMLGGLWLRERGKTTIKHADKWRGFGHSFLMQGAFLFVFDLSAWWVHSRQESKLKSFFQNTGIGFDGQSVGVVWNLR